MKSRLKVGTLDIVAVVLMVLIGVVSERLILPTGMFVAPWAGIIALGILLATDLTTALGISIIALVFMFGAGSANILVIVDVLLTILVIWLVTRRLYPKTHQQLILVGIIAGLLQLVIIEVGLAMMGWFFDQQWETVLAFGRLGLVTSVLTALLYAVFVPLATLACRRLYRQQ